MTLAEKILALRTQRGLSQEELAAKLEVSRILFGLLFPAAALQVGTVPALTLPILALEVLLVKRRTMALVFVTLLLAAGLTWPAFGMGGVVAIFVLTPWLFLLG